jgi:hypothetical protein
MASPAPAIDWQICDDDQEWEARKAWRQTGPAHPARRTAWSPRRTRWACAVLFALFLPLLFAAYRTLQQGDQAMDRVEHEVAAAVDVAACMKPSSVQGSLSATSRPCGV